MDLFYTVIDQLSVSTVFQGVLFLLDDVTVFKHCLTFNLWNLTQSEKTTGQVILYRFGKKMSVLHEDLIFASVKALYLTTTFFAN